MLESLGSFYNTAKVILMHNKNYINCSQVNFDRVVYEWTTAVIYNLHVLCLPSAAQIHYVFVRGVLVHCELTWPFVCIYPLRTCSLYLSVACLHVQRGLSW